MTYKIIIALLTLSSILTNVRTFVYDPSMSHHVLATRFPEIAVVYNSGTLTIVTSAMERAEECIEESEYTDQDICDCLTAQGIEDSPLYHP